MTYNTEKRAKILELFASSDSRSYTAEEVSARVLENGNGKSTVYRLLSKLEAEGLLRKISNDKTGVFEYQYVRNGECKEHFHLKCNKCGKLIHLDEKTSRLLEARIKTAESFEIDLGALIYGKCSECAVGGAKL
jgi:Fur family ferric uptake transcriptional regulator